MTISATTQGIRPGVCLSTSKPSNPFDGQVIYMTDVDQTAVWDGTQWTVLAPIAGSRNAIINGDFKVWQRGTSFSAVSPGVYTADRWTNSYGAVTSNVTRETDVPSKDFSYSLKFAAPSTFSTVEYVLRTWLEVQDVKRFVGKSVTLSFWIKSSKTSVKGRVASYQSTGGQDNQSDFTVAANTWTKINLTATAFSNITAWTAADNAAGCFVDVGFANSQSYTSADYFMVAGIQLEAGSVATPFEFEHYQTTLAKCQRYYFRVGGDSGYQRFGWGTFTGTTSARCEMINPVTMRSLPSSIESSTLALYDQSTLFAVTAFTLSSAGSGKNLTQFDATVASGGTTYRPIDIVANASTSSYIGVSAEL